MSFSDDESPRPQAEGWYSAIIAGSGGMGIYRAIFMGWITQSLLFGSRGFLVGVGKSGIWGFIGDFD